MAHIDHIHSVTVNEIDGGYTQQVNARVHEMTTDILTDEGGADKGPSPYELLLAALGTCTSATIRMYAKRKEWTLDKVTLNLSHRKEKADNGTNKDVITCDIRLDGDLDSTQRARLLEIANKCPVHKTLQGSIDIRSALVE